MPGDIPITPEMVEAAHKVLRQRVIIGDAWVRNALSAALAASALPRVVEALEECLVAIGHIGVKMSYDRGGATDAKCASFLIQIETTEPGGLHGVCERAFTSAQIALTALKGGGDAC